jgi:hypothetical protein
MNLLSPIISVLFGFTGITMEKIANGQDGAPEETAGSA